MGLIQPSYNDRVRYTLQHNEMGSLVITEPLGWKNDEKEYARNEEYHGVFAKFSNSLKFIGSGADYINTADAIYGINADIRLIRDERHPHTDEWTRSYDGYLDMSTRVLEKGEVSVKFNSGGLQQILKTRESDDIEIEREDTIDGKPLLPIDAKKVRLVGRRIFLQSELEITENNTNREAGADVNTNDGGIATQTVGIPLEATINSHQDIIRTVTPEVNGTGLLGDLGMMFLYDSPRDRVFDFNLNISLDAFVQQYEEVDNFAHYWVCLSVYENGFDFNLKERIPLVKLEDVHSLFGHRSGTLGQFTAALSAEYTNPNFPVLDGESVALECFLQGHFYDDNNAGIRVFAQNIIADFKIEENSNYEDSDSKMVLAHELGERLTHIITNRKDVFYSEALGRTQLGYTKDGVDTGAFTGFAHGMWVRGFDKEPQSEENKYKAFTTSFKDYMQSLSAIWNLGMGIEKVGFSERIRVEPLSYFYNFNVTIRLPNQVKKVKRSVAKEYYYSSLEIGSEKGGQYEEAMGLDAYNGRSKFTTIINKVKKTFVAVSKYRYDPYGLEFTRRKPKNLYPSTDTPRDQDVFALDLKRWAGDMIFKMRTWEDDFEQQPTGVFDPNSATNLRFSPVNVLFRHGWNIAAGLTKYATDYVRYASSSANSNLTTKPIGKPERSENGNIINSELPRARFVPEWIEFEHLIDFELNQKLEGSTVILGKEVPNFYGLIEFTNENNDIEKGFLFSVKPNEGKWKVLKANR